MAVARPSSGQLLVCRSLHGTFGRAQVLLSAHFAMCVRYTLHSSSVASSATRVLLQEEEERFRPGTNKAVSLQVLKDAGVEGMSLGEIMDVSQSRGLKDWEPGAKRILQFVSTLLQAELPLFTISSSSASFPISPSNGAILLHGSMANYDCFTCDLAYTLSRNNSHHPRIITPLETTHDIMVLRSLMIW